MPMGQILGIPIWPIENQPECLFCTPAKPDRAIGVLNWPASALFTRREVGRLGINCYVLYIYN